MVQSGVETHTKFCKKSQSLKIKVFKQNVAVIIVSNYRLFVPKMRKIIRRNYYYIIENSDFTGMKLLQCTATVSNINTNANSNSNPRLSMKKALFFLRFYKK